MTTGHTPAPTCCGQARERCRRDAAAALAGRLDRDGLAVGGSGTERRGARARHRRANRALAESVRLAGAPERVEGGGVVRPLAVTDPASAPAVASCEHSGRVRPVVWLATPDGEVPQVVMCGQCWRPISADATA